VWLVLWSGEHEKPNWGILELEYTVERKSRLRLFIKNWICTLGLCEQFCHTCNGFFYMNLVITTCIEVVIHLDCRLQPKKTFVLRTLRHKYELMHSMIGDWFSSSKD
jgi:hypothetical protein